MKEIYLKEINNQGLSVLEIEEAVKRIVGRNAALIMEKGAGAFAALMGDAMKELGGKASGKDISEALKRELQKNA